MNICLLTSSVWPIRDGIKTAVHNLAAALANWGHNVIIVGPYKGIRSSDLSKKYIVIRFGFRGSTRLHLTSLLAVFTLLRIVKKFKIDVINVHDVNSPGNWARYFQQLKNSTPVIGTPHGEDINRYPALKYGRRLDTKIDKIIQRNIKSFTLLTAVSQSIRNELVKILGKEAVIKNIPNGIWTSHFKITADRSIIRKKYGIPNDSIALISVGRNVPVKGFELGVRAVAKLVNSGCNISYILVGRDMHLIKEKAKELGISDMVIAPGELNYEDVAALYHASDIYVSTSHIESFGITTLEAMCSGLPCVVTDVPGNRDLVSSEYGMLVPPESVDELAGAIGNLMNDPLYRKSLGEKARLKAQSFDWMKIAASYVDAYEQAIAAHNNSDQK
jgi:glycosyltransferase involved in cell wall biosynthesis